MAAPEALNAAASAAGSAKPCVSIASMPPVSKKLLAKVARAVKSAAVPRLARKIFGRAPDALSFSSDLSRSASNGAASRIGASASNLNFASP